MAWHCGSQRIVVLSSTEAEWVALSSALKQVLWTVQTMGMAGYAALPVDVWIDNESCIKLTKGQTFFSRSKHITLRYLHARDVGEAGIARYNKISTKLNPADPMSKGVMKCRKTGKTRLEA